MPTRQDESIVVSGELRLFDWDGKRMPVLGGYLLLRQGTDEPLLARLESGLWTTTLSPGPVRVERLTLSGVVAELRESGFQVEDTRSVTLDADVIQGTALRVVDASTGNELTGVWAVPARSAEDLLLAIPPESALWGAAVRDRPSPVVLPRQQESWTFWVGAPPEYAWRSVTIEKGQPGRVRTVALWPAGALTIGLGGPRTEGVLLLSVRRTEDLDRADRVTLECRVGEDARVDGLAPGEYACRLSHGQAGLLGERLVEIRQGVEERLDWTVPQARSELQGALRWPVENGDIAPRLELHRTSLDGTLELASSEPEVFESDGPDYVWSFGERAPGAYTIVVEPIRQTVSVSVSAENETARVSIEGEPAARVRVHPVAPDGEVPEELEICWSRAGLSEVPARREELDGSFVFACVPGPVQVSWLDLGCFCVVPRSFDVAAGPNDLVVELSSAGASPDGESETVTVRFHEAGVPVPVDPEPWHPSVIAHTFSGSGRYLGPLFSTSGLSAHRSSSLELRFSGPGAFAFDPPKVPGYRDLQAMRVEVGGRKVVEIELVPLP